MRLASMMLFQYNFFNNLDEFALLFGFYVAAVSVYFLNWVWVFTHLLTSYSVYLFICQLALLVDSIFFVFML